MLTTIPQNCHSSPPTALKKILIAGLSISIAACATVASNESPNTVNSSLGENFEGQKIVFPIIGTDRSTIGAGILIEAPTGVLMGLSVNGISEGWHGMHFHVKADCSDPEFKNSGGHINPYGKEHGLLNPKGPDNADMPNIYAHSDGLARTEVFSTLVSLYGQEGQPALLDSDGSALVIHANPDDQKTQPIGGAGGRIACGEIKASPQAE